jgi:hypothetical protein
MTSRKGEISVTIVSLRLDRADTATTAMNEAGPGGDG